jgi:hypothetical protein
MLMNERICIDKNIEKFVEYMYINIYRMRENEREKEKMKKVIRVYSNVNKKEKDLRIKEQKNNQSIRRIEKSSISK